LLTRNQISVRAFSPLSADIYTGTSAHLTHDRLR
jgi:hypothetical protein